MGAALQQPRLMVHRVDRTEVRGTDDIFSSTPELRTLAIALSEVKSAAPLDYKSVPSLGRTDEPTEWLRYTFSQLYTAAKRAGTFPTICHPFEEKPSPASQAWIELQIEGRRFVISPNVTGFVDRLDPKIAKPFEYGIINRNCRSEVSISMGWGVLEDIRTPPPPPSLNYALSSAGLVWGGGGSFDIFNHGLPLPVGVFNDVSDDSQTLLSFGNLRNVELAPEKFHAPYRTLARAAYMIACEIVTRSERIKAELREVIANIPADAVAFEYHSHPAIRWASEAFIEWHKLCSESSRLKGIVSAFRVLSHDVRDQFVSCFQSLEYLGTDRAKRSGRNLVIDRVSKVLSTMEIFIGHAAVMGMLARPSDAHPHIIKAFDPMIPWESVEPYFSRSDSVLTADPEPVRASVVFLADQCSRNALRHGATDVQVGWENFPSGTLVWIRDNGPGIFLDGKPATNESLHRLFRGKSSTGGGWGLRGGSLLMREFDGKRFVITKTSLAETAQYPERSPLEAFQVPGLVGTGSLFLFFLEKEPRTNLRTRPMGEELETPLAPRLF